MSYLTVRKINIIGRLNTPLDVQMLRRYRVTRVVQTFRAVFFSNACTFQRSDISKSFIYIRNMVYIFA